MKDSIRWPRRMTAPASHIHNMLPNARTLFNEGSLVDEMEYLPVTMCGIEPRDYWFESEATERVTCTRCTLLAAWNTRGEE